MALAEKIENGKAKTRGKEYRPLAKKIWIVVVYGLACFWMQAPAALGQHGQGGHQGGQVGGGHAGPGAHPAGQVSAPHVSLPPAPRATAPRPPVVFGQRSEFGRVGLGERAGRGQHPVFFHHRVFPGAPFLRLRLFYPNWWMSCGPAWVWEFGCGDWRAPEYPVENYVAAPLVIYEPEYVYYGGERAFVLLFLKDGTAYSVTDYWFVKDQVHFTALEEDGTKSVEEVIGLDELDVQKTIDVNTRRGFRMVRRDEPLEQYLRDHPDANAPLLEVPPKN